MRACCLFLLAPLVAGAQFPAPEQLGVLLERDTNTAAGEFAIRAPDNQVYRYRFDAQTLVQRDTLSGGMGHLNPGDQVTVDSDPVIGSLLRYARTIRVLPSPAQQSAESGVESKLPRTRESNWGLTSDLTLADSRLRSTAFPLLDWTSPTGNLTFAGVVARLTGQSLVLRTRAGEQTLIIRSDTRYVENGDTVEAAELRPNMRVFVRAGKNLYEQVEVYQVIWGEILNPARK
jgi:hypothetical protein